MQSILSNLTYIKNLNYLVNSSDGFVYIFTEKSAYPILFDRYSNLSTKGLILFRIVQYCQIHKNKKNISSTKYFNFSKSIWIDNFVNKSLIKQIKPLVMSYNALSAQFLEGKFPTKIFIPTPSELYRFGKSDFGKSFKYIENGWFYHFINHSFDKGKSFQYDSGKFFDKCSIGDIRMRLAVYAPPSISVIGWKKDSKLMIRHDMKGRKYGAFLEGKHSAKDLLDISGINSNKSKMGKENRFIFIEFFPYKPIAFLAAVAIIVFYSSSPAYFLVNLLFLLDVNIYFRSVIWPNKYCSTDSFWITLAIIQFGTLLYIFFHERTSEIAYVSIYSITIFIILFQFRDFFNSSDFPFVLLNNNIKISGISNSTDTI